MSMNKWYQNCLNYNNSVKEYQTALFHAGFSEETALNAIHKAFQYYYDKNFEPDPDYIIRMDRFARKHGRSRICALAHLAKVFCHHGRK